MLCKVIESKIIKKQVCVDTGIEVQLHILSLQILARDIMMQMMIIGVFSNVQKKKKKRNINQSILHIMKYVRKW